MCDLDAAGAPSIFNVIRSAAPSASFDLFYLFSILAEGAHGSFFMKINLLLDLSVGMAEGKEVGAALGGMTFM